MPTHSPDTDAHSTNTTSVNQPGPSATELCRLADLSVEIATIVKALPLNEALLRIEAILDSIRRIALREGECRGIERGVAITTKTQALLLEKFLGGM